MYNYCFDIETGPLGSDVLELIMPPFDEADVKLGNVKDPVKIAEKIEKARTDHVTRFMRNAALSPLTGEVLAIGVRGPIISNEIKTHIIVDVNERTLIGAFFDYFASSFDHDQPHWIGFNIANFDVPFIVRRAWHHAIAVPEQLLSRRFLNSCFTDIYLHWQLTHYPPEYLSLNSLAQFFGLPAKEGNGAQFAELFRYDRKAAIEYLTNDVAITWEIAKRLGLFRRDQPRHEVQTAAPPILEPEPEIRFY
jgi:hypothetical protein